MSERPLLNAKCLKCANRPLRGLDAVVSTPLFVHKYSIFRLAYVYSIYFDSVNWLKLEQLWNLFSQNTLISRRKSWNRSFSNFSDFIFVEVGPKLEIYSYPALGHFWPNLRVFSEISTYKRYSKMCRYNLGFESLPKSLNLQFSENKIPKSLRFLAEVSSLHH